MLLKCRRATVPAAAAQPLDTQAKPVARSQAGTEGCFASYETLTPLRSLHCGRAMLLHRCLSGANPELAFVPLQVLYRGRGMLVFRFLVRMKVLQLVGAFTVAAMLSVVMASVRVGIFNREGTISPRRAMSPSKRHIPNMCIPILAERRGDV